jgi:hypothetical protein
VGAAAATVGAGAPTVGRAAGRTLRTTVTRAPASTRTAATTAIQVPGPGPRRGVCPDRTAGPYPPPAPSGPIAGHSRRGHVPRLPTPPVLRSTTPLLHPAEQRRSAAAQVHASPSPSTAGGMIARGTTPLRLHAEQGRTGGSGRRTPPGTPPLLRPAQQRRNAAGGSTAHGPTPLSRRAEQRRNAAGGTLPATPRLCAVTRSSDAAPATDGVAPGHYVSASPRGAKT